MEDIELTPGEQFTADLLVNVAIEKTMVAAARCGIRQAGETAEQTAAKLLEVLAIATKQDVSDVVIRIANNHDLPTLRTFLPDAV